MIPSLILSTFFGKWGTVDGKDFLHFVFKVVVSFELLTNNNGFNVPIY